MDNKDKNFEKKLMQNIDEKRAEQEYGAEIEEKLEAEHEVEVSDQEIPPESERRYHPLSEEEAKRMMAEDARQTEANLRNVNSDKHKKTIIAAVIVAVVLCLGMLVLALVLGNKGKNSEETGDNGGSQVEEKPEETEKPEEDGPVEIAVSDALVRKLYRNFDVTNGMMYADEAVLNGDFRGVALGVAALNTEKIACRVVPTEEDLRSQYGDILDQQGLNEVIEESKKCYDAAEVNKKAQEIFGVALDLQDGVKFGSFTAGGQPHYRYDAENQEFYYDLVPGGGVMPTVVHNLEKAMREGNYIYLYDVAGQMEECFIDNTRKTCASPVGESLWNYELGGYDPKYVIDYNLTNENILEHAEEFSRYKWTFSKNTDGNYVLEKIEKVEE